jgi:DNA-binding transcriptional LysR family regulator
MKQLQDVDLKLLRVFMAIVKCGGFSAAQATLNMSQSSISEQMTNLETRLGMTLCERGRGGFRLTEHGSATYEATRQLLLAVDNFCTETSALKQRISGKLYLGIIDNTISDADSPLTRALRRFVSRGHDVHLEVYIGMPAELEERVLDGRLHIAIGHFPLPVAGLDYSQLYQEPDGLFCSRHSQLFAANDEQPELFEHIAASHIVARGYLQQRDLQQLQAHKAAATVDNIEAQAMLILSGAYIGFLPSHYASRWVVSGDMRQIAPQRFRSDWPFTAITRKSVPQSAVLRAFLADLLPDRQGSSIQ